MGLASLAREERAYARPERQHAAAELDQAQQDGAPPAPASENRPTAP
jgi:hypothetical protein